MNSSVTMYLRIKETDRIKLSSYLQKTPARYVLVLTTSNNIVTLLNCTTRVREMKVSRLRTDGRATANGSTSVLGVMIEVTGFECCSHIGRHDHWLGVEEVAIYKYFFRTTQ